eukprot:CAMPEP_0172570440 /NCGR_PEP_ID=MMETSP1067-20121228/127619_1 /TAXON_ID=265564 ORGANISM="Thalassiosira punctigera, Strain Tpunct2005C2" /NCGR_SAMPLE_ID=MMETSP1067 /ASSEMBLY_ACC=CAM_ASM_000444 /LENGTH=37 /DNA_ID= /DNA_START= /DNA_END= /DNA_ORIENTATION=
MTLKLAATPWPRGAKVSPATLWPCQLCADSGHTYLAP